MCPLLYTNTNKGLGHIGTTLDPCFWGVSAIALNNTTDEPIVIKVGDPIVTIMFYTLMRKSSGIHDNMPARVDDNINLNSTEFLNFKNEEFSELKLDKEKYYCKDCTRKNNCEFINNREVCFNEKVLEDIKIWKSKDYFLSKEALIREVKKFVKNNNVKKDIFLYGVLTLLIGVIFISILMIIIKRNKCNYMNDTFNNLIEITIPTVAIVIGLIADYKTKNKGE